MSERQGVGFYGARVAMILLLSGLSLGWVPWGLACEDLRAEATTAAAGRDTAILAVLAEQALIDPACDDGFRRWASSAAARLLIVEAVAAVDGGQPLAAQETKLVRAQRLAPHWLAATMLGDLADSQRDFAAASLRYQAALALIDDPSATETPPPPAEVAALFAKAEGARLAAEQHVSGPSTRDGRPAALGAPQVRGWTVTKVALPITFEFDSVTMTEKGRAYADDLLRSLTSYAGPERIATLVGHTDPSGAAAYNEDLSLRRALAVRAFLEAHGYAGQVRVTGMGERQPYGIADPQRFSAAEQNQFHRRVELVWP